MTTTELTQAADKLRRRRVTLCLFPKSPEYQAFTPDQRYAYLERLGMIVGNGLVTAEAHILALYDARRTV